MDAAAAGANKPRQAKTSGRKVKKKEKAEGKERHNRKAFTYSGGKNSVRKKVQQSADQNTRKTHAPKLDKTPDIAPPYVVVVQGPRGSGKTTLIRSLVKHYTKQNISDVVGPVTLVTSKHRRILCMIDASVGFEMETFEWINLLQNHGFPKVMGVLTHLDKFPETKTIRKKKKEFKARFWAEIYDGAKLFYFSGLQYGRYAKTEVTNLARFVAVQKVPLVQWRQGHPYLLALRWEDQTDPAGKKKKDNDDRSATTLTALAAAGKAKALENNGDDQKIEEIDLNTSSADESNYFRRLHLYGYTYGARLRQGQFVHICGVGDFPISSIEQYTDPCPSPLATELAEGKPNAIEFAEKNKIKKKKVNNLRTLQEKHKAIYAPGCDIGNVLMDRDAVYINLPKHQVGFTKREDEDENAELPEAVSLVRELQGKVGALNDVSAAGKLRLTGRSSAVLSGDRRMAPKTTTHSEGNEAGSDEDGECASSDEEGGDLHSGSEEEDETKNATGAGESDDDEEEEDGKAATNNGRGSDDEEDGDSASDEPEDDEQKLAHKRQFFADAKARFAKDVPLEDLIYGNRRASGLLGNNLGKKKSSTGKGQLQVGGSSSSSSIVRTVDFQDGNSDGPKKLQLFGDASDSEGDDGDALLDDEMNTPAEDNRPESWRLRCLPNESRFLWDEEARAELKKTRFVTGDWNASGREGGGDVEDEDGNIMGNDDLDPEQQRLLNTDDAELSPDELREKKALVMEQRTKQEEKDKNQQDDTDEFGRRNVVKKLNVEDMLEHADALPIGAYVRIVIENVPKISVDGLNLARPLVVGGLLPGELKMGVMQLRIKNHRWAPRVLKSNDVLLASIGWRRFQTLPMFSLEDRNEKRMRFLKYTPEHMHCHMTFFGPLVPPKTGAVFVKSLKNVANYRVSATGHVLESNQSFNVVKKLKLTGEPYKIFKHTAFVKGMFNSDLECNKALHAKLQTVSGIRGEIKKAEGTEGHFRATFEDRILMSDLVLLKSWVQVEPKQFYNPMLDISEWRRMKTIGELRFEQSLPAAAPNNAKGALKRAEDSNYGKQLIRERRKFAKLQLPKSVESNLPFKTVPKLEMRTRKKADEWATEESKMINRAVTSLLKTDREHQVDSALQRLQTVKVDKLRKNTERRKAKTLEKVRKEEKIQALRDAHTKENRKAKYVKQGKEEEKKRKKMRLED
ncbi:unnamed protein product [Amoebophrya sp. A25]|nr:unnamed protein product [Amoebophrya sp. A25]|eukprot:GSA25T00015550001.1